MRLAGRQVEEGGDRLRVPVDVEFEPRLPDALDERQRGRRRLEPDPQALGAARGALVEARALHLVQRLGDLGCERQPKPAPTRVGQPRPPPRARARAASSSGSSPEIVSSAKLPAPPSLPAPTRPTQPVTASASHASTSGATFSQPWRSITPLT